MSGLVSLINSLVDDRRTRDRLTGSRESLPPPLPGLAAADSPRHEGDRCAWATRAYTPQIWTVTQSADPDLRYLIVSTTPIATAGKTSGRQYSHVGGKTPALYDGGAGVDLRAAIPGDSVSLPVPDYQPDAYDPAGNTIGYEDGSGTGETYFDPGTSQSYYYFGDGSGAAYPPDPGGSASISQETNDFFRGYSTATGGYSGGGGISYYAGG